jgi:hypothetical protein
MIASAYGHHADLLLQTCPKKYDFTARQGLSKDTTTALLVGTAVHAALQVYHGMSNTKGEKTIIPGLTPHAASALNEAFSVIKDAEGAEGELKDEANYITMRTLTEYFKTYKPSNDWKIIETEQEFDLELFPGVRSTGRLDGLISVNGQVLVLEHKTTSYTPERFYEEFSHDSQVTRYCRAASLLLDKPVHGVLLNVLQKIKTKTHTAPKFRRFIIVRSIQQINDLEQELKTIRKVKALYEQEDYWPRNRARCFDYFSQCEFYNRCFTA